MRVRLAFVLVSLAAVLSMPAAAAAAPRGTAEVQGHVYTFEGGGQPGAMVFWDTTDESGVAPQSTGPSGAYSLTDLPAASGDGDVGVMVPSTNNFYTLERQMLTWPDPGTTTFDFRPGHVLTNVTLSHPATTGSEVDINLLGSDGPTPVWSDQEFMWSSGQARAAAKPTNAMPGTYSVATCSFITSKYPDRKGEGIETLFTSTVVAGAQGTDTLTFNEASACSLTVATKWASGAPGTSVPVTWAHFPNAWQCDFQGISGYGAAEPQDLGTFPTAGSGSMSFAVPVAARPGYFYYFSAQHVDGQLGLETAFEVCTLNASKPSISSGAAVRLKGVVPAMGNAGRAPKVKVSIYARSSAAGQPTTYDSPKGWKLVGQASENAKGQYASATLHPKRTTYYVVRFPAQGPYWKGFTSVVRVAVH
jgi:hypothetical protein